MRYVMDIKCWANENEYNVWLWCLLGEDGSMNYGNNFDDMVETLDILEDKSNDVYIHNLDYYGLFVLSYIEKHKYKYSKEKRNKPNTYKSFIDGLGKIYTITLVTKSNKRTIFKDSSKKLRFTLYDLAKFQGMDRPYLETNQYKPIGYVANEDDINYSFENCNIIYTALNEFWENDYNGLTISSDAITDYKNCISKKLKNKWRQYV